MAEDASKHDEATRDLRPKHPYEPPRLVEHGTVAELTLGMHGTVHDHMGTGSHSH